MIWSKYLSLMLIALTVLVLAGCTPEGEADIQRVAAAVKTAEAVSIGATEQAIELASLRATLEALTAFPTATLVTEPSPLVIPTVGKPTPVSITLLTATPTPRSIATVVPTIRPTAAPHESGDLRIELIGIAEQEHEDGKNVQHIRTYAVINSSDAFFKVGVTLNFIDNEGLSFQGSNQASGVTVAPYSISTFTIFFGGLPKDWQPIEVANIDWYRPEYIRGERIIDVDPQVITWDADIVQNHSSLDQRIMLICTKPIRLLANFTEDALDDLDSQFVDFGQVTTRVSWWDHTIEPEAKERLTPGRDETCQLKSVSQPE